MLYLFFSCREWEEDQSASGPNTVSKMVDLPQEVVLVYNTGHQRTVGEQTSFALVIKLPQCSLSSTLFREEAELLLSENIIGSRIVCVPYTQKNVDKVDGDNTYQ